MTREDRNVLLVGRMTNAEKVMFDKEVERMDSE
jgi:hypothetical protein